MGAQCGLNKASSRFERTGVHVI